MNTGIAIATAGASILSALIALVAVFYGPKKAAETARQQIESAGFTARQQIIATTISANRQQWINTLRDAISDFISILHVAQVRYDQKQESNDEELARKMMWSKTHIELLINPSEPTHRGLVDQCDRAICVFGERVTDADTREWVTGPEALTDACANITTLAQTILKAEWERVKSGA